MKIYIGKNEYDEIKGSTKKSAHYNGVVGIIKVDESNGYVYPGTEAERIASLCERAVEAYLSGGKCILA